MIKNGILKAIPYAQTKKRKKEEDEEIAKAIDDPESEWLGRGMGNFDTKSVSDLTGGYGPTKETWD